MTPRTRFIGILSLVGLSFTGGLAMAQQATPVPPGQQAVPDWVARYAANQEQIARSCQLQLAQEQAKIDTLTKDLADAKSAAAAAAKPPAPTK